MNKTAGRGDELVITLHLDDGEPLLFLVDTGYSKTVFDPSLESRLGTSLGKHQFSHVRYGVKSIGYFKSPRLYLGETQLTLDRTVGVEDLSAFFAETKQQTGLDRHIVGVLGMDCLRHYCIQLDFARNEMRFLDNARLDKENLGKALPLVKPAFVKNVFFIHENLVGAKSSKSLIDTGCDFDGWLTPALFRQWTAPVKMTGPSNAHSPNAVLLGEVYPASAVNETHEFPYNGIGLRLLARNLVTFDFPNRTMYLKRTSKLPLYDPMAESAKEFLVSLKEKNQLPGWSKSETGTVDLPREFFNGSYPASTTFTAGKNGDSSIYHYTTMQAAEGSPWKLQKAWRTSANGDFIEQYPIQ